MVQVGEEFNQFWGAMWGKIFPVDFTFQKQQQASITRAQLQTKQMLVYLLAQKLIIVF